MTAGTPRGSFRPENAAADRRPAASLATALALLLWLAAVPARAQGASMEEMFRGIPVDRCKDAGGPPPSAPEGPRIESLSAAEGRPGDVVRIAGNAPGVPGPVEVHFLLRGNDVRAGAEGPEGGEIRVRVPDMGAKGDAKGWIYLARGPVRGKARPFLFRPSAPKPR